MAAAPDGVPAELLFDGLIAWHYGPDPPAGVDCAGAEGEWFVGFSGARHQNNHWMGVRSRGSCGNSPTYVLSLDQPPHDLPAGSEPLRVARHNVTHGGALLGALLHESNEEYGIVRLHELAHTTGCPERVNFELEIRLESPEAPFFVGATLIGADGRWLERTELSFRPVGGSHGGSPGITPASVVQRRWAADSPFVPVAFRVQAAGRSVTTRVTAPRHAVVGVAQSARIAVRRGPESGCVQVCLTLPEAQRACPAPLGAASTGDVAAGWTASGLISWQSAPTADQVANAIDPLGGCALTEAVGAQAWQLTTLGNAGTAIQVGQRQFLTSSRLFVGDTPWAVVAQCDRALPVVRVAADPRNGLALLEVIGPADSILHEPAPTFASETGEREASLVHTVNYAAGRADRFAMSAALLRRVSERTRWSARSPSCAQVGALRIERPHRRWPPPRG